MEEIDISDSADVHILQNILRVLIGSYLLGWGILIANVGTVPLFNGIIWEFSAFACAAVTIWLISSLTKRALVAWSAVVLTVVTLRSFAYIQEGIFNPAGVWLLVLSGVSVTNLAVITVNALIGREERLKT